MIHTTLHDMYTDTYKISQPVIPFLHRPTETHQHTPHTPTHTHPHTTPAPTPHQHTHTPRAVSHTHTPGACIPHTHTRGPYPLKHKKSRENILENRPVKFCPLPHQGCISQKRLCAMTMVTMVTKREGVQNDSHLTIVFIVSMI